MAVRQGLDMGSPSALSVTPRVHPVAVIIGGYFEGYNDGSRDGRNAGFQQGAIYGGSLGRASARDQAYTDGYQAGFLIAQTSSSGTPQPGATSNPPVVTVVTALPPATATTPIVITVVGGNSPTPIRRAWIAVVFPGIIATEMIHNGNQFGLFYTNNTNSRVTYTDGSGRVGYQYTILRDGGWPTGAFPLATSLDISAVDTAGIGT